MIDKGVFGDDWDAASLYVSEVMHIATAHLRSCTKGWKDFGGICEDRHYFVARCRPGMGAMLLYIENLPPHANANNTLTNAAP